MTWTAGQLGTHVSHDAHGVDVVGAPVVAGSPHPHRCRGFSPGHGVGLGVTGRVRVGMGEHRARSKVGSESLATEGAQKGDEGLVP